MIGLEIQLAHIHTLLPGAARPTSCTFDHHPPTVIRLQLTRTYTVRKIVTKFMEAFRASTDSNSNTQSATISILSESITLHHKISASLNWRPGFSGSSAIVFQLLAMSVASQAIMIPTVSLCTRLGSCLAIQLALIPPLLSKAGVVSISYDGWRRIVSFVLSLICYLEDHLSHLLLIMSFWLSVFLTRGAGRADITWAFLNFRVPGFSLSNFRSFLCKLRIPFTLLVSLVVCRRQYL
jgi:hypothetical protein